MSLSLPFSNKRGLEGKQFNANGFRRRSQKILAAGPAKKYQALIVWDLRAYQILYKGACLTDLFDGQPVKIRVHMSGDLFGATAVQLGVIR
ncbi:hypothetical protein [Rhodoplanes sp. Z2-YC6860]|uniref:hypothetical protein n=1 Tax=Rhodoplanes sp. Z2-YC6860 TaxID=674703 RepID=UPI00082ED6E4|nr:hypothetical protein [Rhodoplanes sp. Z2-YC6860]